MPTAFLANLPLSMYELGQGRRAHLHDHLLPVLDLLTWRRTRSQLHFGNFHRLWSGTLGFVALNHQLIPHLSAALENAVRGKLQNTFRAKFGRVLRATFMSGPMSMLKLKYLLALYSPNMA